MKYKCVMCQQPISRKEDEWGMEIRITKWMHYKCIEHLWDAYSSMQKEKAIVEPKPYWIGGAKDGRFSCQLIPLKIDNEPLSTKQLHEIIISQNITIDRMLDDKSHYMEVVRKLYDDIKVVELWIEHGVPGYAKKRLQDVKAIIDNVLDK